MTRDLASQTKGDAEKKLRILEKRLAKSDRRRAELEELLDENADRAELAKEIGALKIEADRCRQILAGLNEDANQIDQMSQDPVAAMAPSEPVRQVEPTKEKEIDKDEGELEDDEDAMSLDDVASEEADSDDDDDDDETLEAFDDDDPLLDDNDEDDTLLDEDEEEEGFLETDEDDD